MPPDDKHAALYYPYSRCVDADLLKLLALLYEEIVFVDPLEEHFREFLISQDAGCQYVPAAVTDRWNRNREDWQTLRERSVLRMVDPQPEVTEHDHVLTAAYAADMADPDFVLLAEDQGGSVGPWKMLDSRVPPSVSASFERHDALPGRVEGGKPLTSDSDYQIGVYAWEQYDHFGYREYVLEQLEGHRPSHRPREVITPWRRVPPRLDSPSMSAYQQLLLSGGGTCTEDGRPFGAHPYDYADNVADADGKRILLLSFAQGSSLSISQTLILAEEHGLMPVTDSPVHEQLMARRHRRAVTEAARLERSRRPRRSAKVLERYAIVARTVLLETLDRGFLERLTMSAALDFRDANMEALQRYWTTIAEISHEVDDLPAGPAGDEHLIKLMDTTVLPQLRRLTDALATSKRRLLSGTLSQAATAALPASAGISLFAGFSAEALLALSVGAGAATFGPALSNAIDRWQDRKTIDQNWLTYCVDLGRLR